MVILELQNSLKSLMAMLLNQLGYLQSALQWRLSPRQLCTCPPRQSKGPNFVLNTMPISPNRCQFRHTVGSGTTIDCLINCKAPEQWHGPS